MKLIIKFLAKYTLTSASCSSWITSLNHKVLDNTMENNTIVIPFANESKKILYRSWREVIREFKSNITIIGAENNT